MFLNSIKSILHRSTLDKHNLIISRYMHKISKKNDDDQFPSNTFIIILCCVIGSTTHKKNK